MQQKRTRKVKDLDEGWCHFHVQCDQIVWYHASRLV